MILIPSLHLAGLKGMLLFLQLQSVYGCIHSAYHSRHSTNIYWLKKILLKCSFCFKVYYWEKKWIWWESLLNYNIIYNHRLPASLEIRVHVQCSIQIFPLGQSHSFSHLLVAAKDSQLMSPSGTCLWPNEATLPKAVPLLLQQSALNAWSVWRDKDLTPLPQFRTILKDNSRFRGPCGIAWLQLHQGLNFLSALPSSLIHLKMPLLRPFSNKPTLYNYLFPWETWPIVSITGFWSWIIHWLARWDDLISGSSWSTNSH